MSSILSRSSVSGFALIALSGLVGCGVAGDDWSSAEGEDLQALEQGLSSSCGSATPQSTHTGRVSGGLLTASAANQAAGCQGNSYIFDINNYNSGFNPLAPPLLQPSVVPNNQTDCEASDLRYYVWEKTGASVVFLGSRIQFAVWETDPLLAGCVMGLSSPVTLQSGRSYRFGVTHRRPSTTNRALKVVHQFQPQ